MRYARYPRLHAAILAWRNDRTGARRGVLAFAAAVLAASTGAGLLLARQPLALAAFGRLPPHALLIGLASAALSGVWLTMRRTEERSRASAHWSATLPRSVRAQRAESLLFAAGPVAGLLVALVLIVALVGLTAAFTGLPAPLVPAGALLLGGFAGMLLALVWPARRPATEYEGSRYVPTHRRTGPRCPQAALRALGIWPLRKLFASARPQTLARALLPVLLSVGLGSAAADVVLLVGLAGAVAATGVLVRAAHQVAHAARVFLRTQPLSLLRIGAAVLSRLPLALALTGGLAGGFASLLGEPARVAGAQGLALCLVGLLAAILSALRTG